MKIPGGVDAYVVDLRGERYVLLASLHRCHHIAHLDVPVAPLSIVSMEPTPAMWQETYVSALLRAIRYADDPSYRLAGYRKLDPITTPEAEQRFLEAAEAVFFRGTTLSLAILEIVLIDSICVGSVGWQLGSDPEIQVATVISNHLTAGIMKYFGDSYRLQHAANLFEKLVDKEPEVAALLAKSYIGMSKYERACGWSRTSR